MLYQVDLAMNEVGTHDFIVVIGTDCTEAGRKTATGWFTTVK
jgi:hypothetical protein